VLDRESTFAHPDIVSMLKQDFVPVAIDQAYQRRQKDAEGDFYRKIASQSPRNDFRGTTQGFYAATGSGHLLFYNNNRDPDKVSRMMRKALQDAAARVDQVEPIVAGERDRRYAPELPEGGAVVRVRSKVLGGYPPTDNRWEKIFQNGLGRDNLWVSGEEHTALVRGVFPDTLMRRLARFHLVDNTRGEPPMWRLEDLRTVELTLNEGVLKGMARLQTADGKRSFEATLYGRVESKDGKLTRFDLVAQGLFQGAGRFTRTPPPGKFPFAVSFTLADGSDRADAIPPQGSRGWVEGYLR
jgi:hypothetical protein